MKEGRHVGLDFYDLLIEALMGHCPRASGARQCLALAAHGATTIRLCSSGALNDGCGSFKSKRSDSAIQCHLDQFRLVKKW
jgi:hypothetical protein